MNALGSARARVAASGAGPALACMPRGFIAAVLAVSVLAAGCEHPFEPFRENDGAVFSMFGYLDLNADTQWVRVMPIRQDLFFDPEPIDAVVTLEHRGNGRTVTLNDSLFRFVDARLDGVAYAYNFWTTERIEPGASYGLTAARSDGASATARVVLPAEIELSTVHHFDAEGVDFALLEVRAEKVLFVETVYTMLHIPSGRPATSIRIDTHWAFATSDPTTHGIGVWGDTLQREDLMDMRRLEIHLAVGRSDWPYHPELSDLTVTLPNAIPSNIENGLGFVGSVATSKIPFDACLVLVSRPDGEDPCTILMNADSAAIEGRVIRAPCGEPHPVADVHLTQRFAGGGAVLRSWKTGWDGSYRFEGIEPGADLVLEADPDPIPVELPRLAPGERHTVSDISVPVAC